MKHIMISIKPEWVAKILNGEKRWEIRLSCPEDECIVEIYCTKDKKKILTGTPFVSGSWKCFNNEAWSVQQQQDVGIGKYNGKVVAKFLLNKSAKYKGFNVDTIREVSRNSKVPEFQIYEYSMFGERPIFAWFITGLKIYDKPKELAEFGLKRPFQSWGYLEDEV